MDHDNCLPRSELRIPFEATPREVPALRRILRQHLTHWGLLGVAEPALLCVSELVTNVIKHVGVGVSGLLAVSMSDTNLRLEVQDPSVDKLPALPGRVEDESEGGRGLALIDMMCEKWGVRLTEAGKVTWCELATALTSPHGHVRDHHVSRADELLTSYSARTPRYVGTVETSVVRSAEEAVRIIADLLHWIRAHGLDPESTLEKAQECFEGAALMRRSG
ncbi:ATP-binding protein [Streptomyces niveiscabiei]|uniref:ATP-binding protein n=1 Tax=Streptomyces niveiscabiei TaxID=164115 RepID=UPI0029A728FB|nr:ATP-binding protein [Streptomyces niveiscabiei]MDX3383599.1 ATP-binding protein [Streptomyces niveiscabiei]